MKHKRKITIALTAILCFQPLMADGMFQGYGTGSSPQRWTDGGGGKYLYGGNFTYRFKRDTAFKPILDIEPPGIQAGCSGISISGGFIHLLGLDELKAQLQSAGQGAMMGVVVGLVYSLPGIADAFDKVHKYVRMLQSLLSNSCQATSHAVEQFIAQSKTDAKNNSDVTMNNAVGHFYNMLSTANGNWNDLMNQGSDAFLSAAKTAVGNSSQETKTTTAGMAQIKCGKICMEAGKSFNDIATYVANNVSDPSSKAIASGTLSTLKNVLVSDKAREKAMEFDIVFLGYDAPDVIPQNLTSDQAAQFLQTAMQGKSSLLNLHHYPGLFFDSTDANGSTVATILLYGNGGSTISVPNIKTAPFYDAPSTADGNSTESLSAGIIFGKKETAGANTYPYDWSGLIPSTITYLTNVIINNDTTAFPPVPTVFPGMNKYINTLRAEYMLGNNREYVLSLINLLAEKNSILLLQAIITEMESQLDATSKQELKDKIQSINNEIERLNKADTSISDTVALFEKIEAARIKAVTNKTKK